MKGKGVLSSRSDAQRRAAQRCDAQRCAAMPLGAWYESPGCRPGSKGGRFWPHRVVVIQAPAESPDFEATQQDDLYAPVAGDTFDRIVAQLVSSGEQVDATWTAVRRPNWRAART